jgi:hypothetical protein
LAVLDVDPEDAGANTIVGRYIALVKGDFGKAVPHLAKSDDARLQPLAQRDAAGAVSPEDRLTLADAWFDLAAADAELAPLYARARHWYELAEQGAAGLVAVRIRSRLDLIAQAETSGAFVDRARPASSAAASKSAAATAGGSSGGMPPGANLAGGSSSPPRSSTTIPPPSTPFGPGPPFAGGPPPSGAMPKAAYDRVNRLAPSAWRAVLPQRDSRQVILNPAISIQNNDGVVTVSKQRSPEFESIHLINDIPMPPEFTARLSVTFPKTNSAGGGTRIPYIGMRSPDGRSQTYVHGDSISEGETHEIVFTRRGGPLSVTWNGQPKRVYDDNNLVPAQIFFHLNDDAEVIIQSLVIEP